MDSNQHSREKILWMAIIPQFVLLLISIGWIYNLPRDNVLVFLKFDPKALFEGLLTGVGLATAGYGFYRLSKKTKSLCDIAELFEKILAPTFTNLKIIDVVFLSLTAGFCEEIFFRGLLLPKIGIIFSSVAFGLLHMPGKKYWIYTVWATLSGALFGWLFLLSKSLWLPITAHAVNNIIGMVLLTRMKK